MQKKFLVIAKASKEIFVYCDAWFHCLNNSYTLLYNTVHYSASQEVDQAVKRIILLPSHNVFVLLFQSQFTEQGVL